MIRRAYVYNPKKERIFYYEFSTMKPITKNHINAILSDLELIRPGIVYHTTFVKGRRLSYVKDPFGYLYMVLNDEQTDKSRVEAFLILLYSYTNDRYADRLAEANDPPLQESEELIERLEATARQIPIKVTLVGFGGVGKTTIRKLLMGIDTSKAEHLQYRQTHIGARSIVKIRGYDVYIFDVGGQDVYHGLWNEFLYGSEVILVVTDSTKEDVENVKNFILPKLELLAPGAEIYVIANKQDKVGKEPDYMHRRQVEKIVNMPTFPCVAINPEYREPLLELLETLIFGEAKVREEKKVEEKIIDELSEEIF